ncbi:snapalysin family zinc-dependent metalloprotease [Micromonospora sp. CPCC 206060]|uniref:snapalysin family zinc-dependent metalloprotease n=1 Tax=Micromonospora sp. CPCC 206060 TaxID=3122406 RepID=UPI002FF3F8E1
MSARRLHRLLATLVAGAVAVIGAPFVSASPALAARTICYDTSQAGSFASTAHSAASIWNNYTDNITMSNCGTHLRIYQIWGGGSYAVRTSLGYGRVYIDTYQAQQYSPLRIMTHEIGHILGLPDNYNGQCSLLMSGGSAGTSCTNPYPAASEADRVDQLFAGTARTTDANTSTVFQGSWPAPAPAAVPVG